ncbi:MAG: hypothetical protein FD170_3238 [Bacteroidetes bacterium]|nr:MAG: hypothetical protein FD170_3238 [Bacteroidota bacterium]
MIAFVLFRSMLIVNYFNILVNQPNIYAKRSDNDTESSDSCIPAKFIELLGKTVNTKARRMVWIFKMLLYLG